MSYLIEKLLYSYLLVPNQVDNLKKNIKKVLIFVICLSLIYINILIIFKLFNRASKI